MKTILDKLTRDGLVARINSLTENSTAEWGEMTVCQMLKHCILAEGMYRGENKYPRMFLGRLIGKVALKGLLKDDAPMRRNSPTIPHFKISETGGDVAAEKKKWIALINDYQRFNNPDFAHPFFGKMTEEQVGILVYKHADHHLRQFGV